MKVQSIIAGRSMKTINETFEDKEFEELTKMKGETSWHDFIMLLVGMRKVKK